MSFLSASKAAISAELSVNHFIKLFFFCSRSESYPLYFYLSWHRKPKYAHITYISLIFNICKSGLRINALSTNNYQIFNYTFPEQYIYAYVYIFVHFCDIKFHKFSLQIRDLWKPNNSWTSATCGACFGFTVCYQM